VSGLVHPAARAGLAITTPLGPGTVALVGLTGREAVSEPFLFELELRAATTTDLAPLLGAAVGVTLGSGD
jgi:uncharacterized protein involved in type VI secretion and phage assembly